MNNILKVRATLDDLSITLNSWEKLPAFNIVSEITNSIFGYTVDGYEITLRARGTYRIEMALNLSMDIETSVGLQFRLNVNGSPQPITTKGFSENTILMVEDITIEDETEISVEVYVETDDTPVISVVDNCLLLITKTR